MCFHCSSATFRIRFARLHARQRIPPYTLEGYRRLAGPASCPSWSAPRPRRCEQHVRLHRPRWPILNAPASPACAPTPAGTTWTPIYEPSRQIRQMGQLIVHDLRLTRSAGEALSRPAPPPRRGGSGLSKMPCRAEPRATSSSAHRLPGRYASHATAPARTRPSGTAPGTMIGCQYEPSVSARVRLLSQSSNHAGMGPSDFRASPARRTNAQSRPGTPRPRPAAHFRVGGTFTRLGFGYHCPVEPQLTREQLLAVDSQHPCRAPEVRTEARARVTQGSRSCRHRWPPVTSPLGTWPDVARVSAT